MPSRQQYECCYCVQCGPSGTRIAAAELPIHQRHVRESVRENQEGGITRLRRRSTATATADRESRVRDREATVAPARRSTRATTNLERQSLSVNSESRVERNVNTARGRNLLAGIQEKVAVWIERAYSEGLNLPWTEAKLALDSLTAAFHGIQHSASSLDALKDEVAQSLDNFELILDDLRSRDVSRNTAPVVHDSRKFLTLNLHIILLTTDIFFRVSLY